jgi:SET domain-containing protein
MGFVADEVIAMGEFVIKYTGNIDSDNPKNIYVMMYKGMKLWIDPSKLNTLAKYMNHSCNPNCKNVT